MLEIRKITMEGKDLQLFRGLLVEYEEELEVNLSFQSFEEELQNPLIKYAPPNGSLLIAFYSSELAGCVGLQRIAGDDTCEMKRMFVRQGFRQGAIGKALALAILEEARSLGYKKMMLDTLERLKPAIGLYKRLGFTVTTPYYHNPEQAIQPVVFMEMSL